MSATAINPTVSCHPSIIRAGNWFLESGIQEPEGGVARFYLVDEQANRRISTEITGYAVSALCYVYERTREPRYLEGAASAARFLLRSAWDNQRKWFPYEWPPSSRAEENRVYFFDSGIIIRGLMRYWRASGDAEALQIAAACGERMATLHERAGKYAPILQLPEGEPLAYAGSWSKSPGCYQLKSALGCLELYQQTGQSIFRDLYEQALGQALENDPQFLPGTERRAEIMDRLHAYCYFLEGLLPVADRAECAAALKRGIGAVAHYLRAIAPEFARSDVYSQLLRVRLLADAAGVAALDAPAAREEAAAIAAFQYASSDRRLDGGFCFGRRNGALMPYANPVSTAFSMQALDMWHNFERGSLEASWRDLV